MRRREDKPLPTRSRRCWRWFPALLILAVASVTLAQETNQPELPLVPSRQYAFRIPFTVDGITAGTKFNAEVQLHVSDDRGATWKLAARVAPEQREFKFQAPHDGEYWFLVRTRDAGGQLRPDGPPAPQMRVLVDTGLPQLSIKAARGATGELNVKLRAVDPHLQLDATKITYQTASGEWRNVAVKPLKRDPASLPGEDIYIGEATFWANDLGSGSLVRAEVRDLAGNLTVEQVKVEGSAAQSASAPPATMAPVAEPQSPAPASSAPGPAIVTPAQPAAETLPAPLPDTRPSPSISNASLAKPASTSSDELPPAPVTTPQQLPAQLGQTPLTNASPATPSSPEALPLPAPTNAPTANTPFPQLPVSNAALPAGVQPRMVNLRQFEMEYDVTSTAPESIAKVELWVTRDGGQTWALNGFDDDRRSPYRVTAPEDGVYGYRMVIETADGMRSPEPRGGDLPDVWVGIDTVKPTAMLLPVQFSTQPQPGKLTLRWQADDRQLSARPVTLSFAADPAGPWSTIASGLENTGRYDWRADARVPLKVYLRLEVRDEAGNLAQVVGAEPISLEELRPRGKILNIRPVGATP